MCCIALVRCVLVLRCGSTEVVWYRYAGFSLHNDTTSQMKEFEVIKMQVVTIKMNVKCVLCEQKQQASNDCYKDI